MERLTYQKILRLGFPGVVATAGADAVIVDGTVGLPDFFYALFGWRVLQMMNGNTDTIVRGVEDILWWLTQLPVSERHVSTFRGLVERLFPNERILQEAASGHEFPRLVVRRK